MLHFFRKYQQYIFLAVTIVIIISFSFFGTYGTLDSNPNIWREQVAFKAVDGHEVTRLDLEDMATFLATDNQDKMLYGGAWGPNFLNDGVISKDFIETGMATELALAYKEDLQEEYAARLAKEKKYKLYTHPEARFLGVETVWNRFSPGMVGDFHTLRTSKNSLDSDAFKSRVALYSEQKRIPPSTLRYILRLQEKQYDWLQPDPMLDQIDLSLFGYRTFEDWFGPKMTRLVAEFIINAAILAEAQGYEVSRAETLADLMRNTQISYKENLDNPSLGVASPEEYYNEQLRRLNMDQGRVLKIWRQVLLFRRYFQDAGAVALVDALPGQMLGRFGYENVNVDLYRLPAEFRFPNAESLKNFELYLSAVAEENPKDPLAIPNTFFPAKQVSVKYPELVQNRYELEIVETDPKALQARIGLRELWNAETEEKQWETLKGKFPQLASVPGKTVEERFEALDNLDPSDREKIDAFVKEEIVKNRPEWTEEALSRENPKKAVVGIRTQGGNLVFSGADTKELRLKLMKLLDEAPLGIAPDINSPLYAYSADNRKFYRITVLKRSQGPEILTFAEAQSDGTLNILKKRMAKDDKRFQTVLTALRVIQTDSAPSPDAKTARSEDEAAGLRFYPYVKSAREQIEKGNASANDFVKLSPNESGNFSLSPALTEQWKLEKTVVNVNRQERKEGVKPEEVTAMSAGSWSPVKTTATGNILFYRVNETGLTPEDSAAVSEQTNRARTLLGNEAQRHLMAEVLTKLQAKNALSLAYLKTPSDGEGTLPTETLESADSE